MRLILLLTLALLAFPLFAQKKPLDFDALRRWKKIEQPQLTPDGRWAAYVLAPVTEGDSAIVLHDLQTNAQFSFARATRPRFTDDNEWLIFRLKPALDTLKAQRRRKVKDEDLNKDTLALYRLPTGTLEKIPNVRGYSVPEKYAGWLVYQLEPEKVVAPKKDSTQAAKPPADSLKTTTAAKKSAKKSKKENKENGYRLLIRNLATGQTDTFPFVQQFVLAKREPHIVFTSSGPNDTLPAWPRVSVRWPGVYWYDLPTRELRPLYRGKGKYQQLALDEPGVQAAFMVDSDTTKARIRPWRLAYWERQRRDTARILATPQSEFLPANWALSDNTRPIFSENGEKLYFGVAPPPVLNDTTLLPEEIVNVEVWTSNDARLYTEQKNRLEADRKRAYPMIWHTRRRDFVGTLPPLASVCDDCPPALLASDDRRLLPEWRYTESRNADFALAMTEEPYAQAASWEGTANRDVYVVNLKNGERRLVVSNKRVRPSLSAAARYVLWWSDSDTAWYASPTSLGPINLAENRDALPVRKLTAGRSAGFFDEKNDVPDYPDPYGIAGWLEKDDAVLVYDRYDIWSLDPDGKKAPRRLTRGRETQTEYRYVKLDPEERFFDSKAVLLLHTFNDQTKAEGYAWLDLNKGLLSPWLGRDNYAYARQPLKAKNAPVLLYAKQNYQTFPDLLWTRLDEPKPAERRLSHANPQQAEYQWGNIELVEWTSLSGEKLQGLLVKPEGFDPRKQYPMIVNFYERLTDGLHTHRSPDAHRSTINFTQYASRGYLVFAPDIPYRNGYPGQSAYDAVVSGVTDLIDRGFVDAKRIGLQGHSWGGYQAAYLVTRTKLFACAEAGAPVANMTSAYGGIRWESGLSRMFQYERQQSRIGGTLWQYPLRYLENSPLFTLDKVETPLLILHNDKDGAVPWYQGIELFTGLRRLGKPAWLLNYNDEPHWPVKLQNRLDFQRRMQQFFDYYLLGAPMPRWMQRGVPPLEKGIRQGLETGN